jgi:hypothetical protein
MRDAADQTKETDELQGLNSQKNGNLEPFKVLKRKGRTDKKCGEK